MIMKRLAMGAIAAAAMLGLAAGPLASGAGAATANNTVAPHSQVIRGFNVNCRKCVNVQGNLHWTGNGVLKIGFKDIGTPGDSFRATYTDPQGSYIVGKCAFSSKTNFYQSLAVHIPSTRNFKVRITWCSGPGQFPAGGKMLLTT